MGEIIKTPKEVDRENRLKEFQEEYKKLVEKYQVDFQAIVQPMIKFVDLRNLKNLKK